MDIVMEVGEKWCEEEQMEALSLARAAYEAEAALDRGEREGRFCFPCFLPFHSEVAQIQYP